MKIYLYLILNIFLSFSLSLEKDKLNEQIINDDEIKLIYEGNIFNNTIIEFDDDYIITQIIWTKKEDYKYNYLLGVFEVSNDTTFMEGIPIEIIREKGELEETNILNINSQNSLKYLRYIPPNQNIWI